MNEETNEESLTEAEFTILMLEYIYSKDDEKLSETTNAILDKFIKYNRN